MFGINDALVSDSKKYVSPAVFKSNYKKLLNEISSRDPNTFIVIMTATTNDQMIDEHVYRTLELAREENIPYIDTNRLWSEHFDACANNFGYGDWLAGGADACHPTPKAAEIMSEYIFENFFKIISAK